MPKPTNADWAKWHAEIEHFHDRTSDGFAGDIIALETHIKKLVEICPKDAIDYPIWAAREYILQLQTALENAKRYLTLFGEK